MLSTDSASYLSSKWRGALARSMKWNLQREREAEAAEDATRGGQYSEDDGLDFVDNELEETRRLQIARCVHLENVPRTKSIFTLESIH